MLSLTSLNLQERKFVVLNIIWISFAYFLSEIGIFHDTYEDLFTCVISIKKTLFNEILFSKVKSVF